MYYVCVCTPYACVCASVHDLVESGIKVVVARALKHTFFERGVKGYLRSVENDDDELNDGWCCTSNSYVISPISCILHQ